ncbi:MAG TPA: MarR family transcriptional regulator [Mycobacteriales bacterium]|nr:MarR family transcriptional regulator [Mycobacteriales bacterium]
MPSAGPATQADAAPSPAVDLLTALRAVIKAFEHLPIPVDEQAQEAWRQAPPAPRHVAALMRVVAEEPLSVTRLAERLGVSLATASQLVTDLEAHGLVERAEDAADRRRTLVRVAESQRAVANALLDTRLRPMQRALDRMRPTEHRALLRGLELIAEELDTND